MERSGRRPGHPDRSMPFRREIMIRLRTVEGHLRAVQRMVEGRPNPGILHQVLALKASIHSVGLLVLRSHLHVCAARRTTDNGSGVVSEIMGAVAAVARKG